jgi:hypothetical protein
MFADTLGVERLQLNANAQQSTAAIHSISDFDFFGLSGFFGSVLGARCVQRATKNILASLKEFCNHGYLAAGRAAER